MLRRIRQISPIRYLQDNPKNKNKMKTKSFLPILLFTILGVTTMSGQDEYLEITKSSRKISTLGGGQQFTEKWPIPELRDYFQTIILTATILTDIDMDAFIEDMNENPRITMLKISTSLKKNHNPETIQKIPFGKLMHVKHLAFVFDSYDSIPLNKIINWNDVAEMKSLEYLYLQPHSEYGSSGEDIQIPENIKKILAKNLKGYFNYGYSGELDKIPNNFESLGIIVKGHQENQKLNILSKGKNLKTLLLSVDTIKESSISEIFKLKTLTSLRIHEFNLRPNYDFASVGLQKLRSLECNTNQIRYFQKFASQIESLRLVILDKKVYNVGKFLSSAISLKKIHFEIYQDSLIRFKLPKILPLVSLEVSGRLKELPEDICQFSGLERLIVSYNELNTLPKCIGRLKKLRIVDISNNSLEEEPPFWMWENLEELELGRNRITNISNKWGANKKLKKLNLRYNPLNGNLGTLSELTDLEELDLSSTCTDKIPDDIHKLQNIKKLDYGKYGKVLSDDITLDCDSSITNIPPGISQLSNLRFISLQGHKHINEQELINLLKIESDSIKINLRKCGIDTLPSTPWNNDGIKQLDLSRNEISNIPKDMFSSTIQKINLRGNNLGKLNQSIDNQAQKLLWQFMGGLDVTDELSQRSDLIDEVIKVGNRFYYKPEENPILDLMPLILPLDTLQVLSKINASKYGQALFKAKRFREAQEYLTLAIKKQKEGCIIFANSIAELHNYRHKCHLELGDTLSAIEDLNIISKEYGFFVEDEIFEIELQLNNTDEILRLRPLIIDKLKAARKKDTTEINIGLELSILELYLVTNDVTEFKRYSSKLKELDEIRNNPIFEYLNILSNISLQEYHNFHLEKLKRIINEQNFTNESWSCDLVTHWSRQKKPQEREIILELNKLICPN